jgi:dienelactone hydrolase
MQIFQPLFAALLALLMWGAARAQSTPQQVVDMPTRPGVTQRLLFITPPEPKAVAVLLPGGHGGLGIFSNGSIKWGEANFLVRSRHLFVQHGLAVALLDAPSDRQSPPFLRGFRNSPEHVADLKAVMAWLRKQNANIPVWLVGTSRGTQSVAFVATELSGSDGPDGIVLSSSILIDPKDTPVPAMPLGNIRVPVLVVHHEQDGCWLCAFSEMPALMGKLSHAQRSQLLSFKGGENKGDTCAAMAHHGFNGLESEVVGQAVAWMLAR